MKHLESLGWILMMAMAIEAVALIVSVLAAAGGHGTYAPAKVMFPYTMALTGVTGSITPVLVGLAFIQYPALALAMWTLRGASTRQWRWLGLSAVHLLAIVAAFVAADDAFTP
jgi:hypothetical protein